MAQQAASAPASPVVVVMNGLSDLLPKNYSDKVLNIPYYGSITF